MNKLLYMLMGFIPLFATSCMDVDNFEEPVSRIYGKVIDTTTGENFITEQGGFSIRIWEKSWSDQPTPLDLPVKQDGTFNNSRMFSGTYDMLPNNGAFWPADTIRGVKVGSSCEQVFKVTPYLHITDVNSRLEGTTLYLSCKLHAPITQNLPTVKEIRPFVSLTQFCGVNNRINEYFKDDYRCLINQNWWDGVGNMETGISDRTYELPPLTLKSGRTFYVRIGANVRSASESYNYSPVLEIKVP